MVYSVEIIIFYYQWNSLNQFQGFILYIDVRSIRLLKSDAVIMTLLFIQNGEKDKDWTQGWMDGMQIVLCLTWNVQDVKVKQTEETNASVLCCV